MDEIDRSILNVLQDNSRLSFRKIAQKIGVTAATVSARVSDMENKGIIKKYTVLLDYDQLDKETLLITVDADLSRIDDIVQVMAEFPEICCVLRVTGNFDLVALVRCDGHKGARKVLTGIKSIPGVRMVNSQMVLQTIQETLCVRM
jgi:Lrp/AsnC family transcriptional regulator for asnA, asnC and gidA